MFPFLTLLVILANFCHFTDVLFKAHNVAFEFNHKHLKSKNIYLVSSWTFFVSLLAFGGISSLTCSHMAEQYRDVPHL